MTKLKCVVCRARPRLSIGIDRCEVCLYREEKGSVVTERQLALAEAERRRKRERLRSEPPQ